MFKKLKDKIAEEVKQSPLKSVQQFAQAVVSPSSSSVFEPSSSNDKFCIEEGDIEEEKTSPTKSPAGGGFTSVTLTGQISSPARRQGPRAATADIENLFPVFESQPTNFHVQSDWESASEVEDRGQLEHISKENLYDAYRKVYGRYNKMKNKYQELVTHYRQLEREKDKAKTVLTETQDKALLRISELREQCLLEQQAKAHLEEALRNELEEKDHIINSLKTKVQYLRNVNDGVLPENVDIGHLPGQEMDNLIDFTENSCVSKVPLPSIASSNLEKLEWLHQQMTSFNKFLVDRTTNIEHLQSQLEELKKKSVNITTSSLETSNSDKLAFQTQSEEETKLLYQSLINITNEFNKETKLVQNEIKTFLHKGEEDKLANLELSITDSFVKGCESELSASTSTEKEDVELSSLEKKEKNYQSLHSDEIKKLNQTIKDLEIINEQLMGEKRETEHIQSDMLVLNETLNLIKTQLEYTKEFIEKGNYDINNLNLTQTTENDVIKDLNLFISNFVNSKSELDKLKSVVVNFENELKMTKDEVNYLKTKEKSDLVCFENQNENLIEKHNELKEHLDRLQNENNDKLAHEESLITELNDMKKINENLEVQVMETKKLVESSEELYSTNEKEFHQIKIVLEEEKNVLQNKIIKLNEVLDKKKADLSSLLHLKDSLTNQISTLKKENHNVLLEKENLQSYIEELKSNAEQGKQEYLAIKTLNTSLMEELSLLKKEHINAATEKTILLENIFKLETSVKHLTDDLTESKRNCESIQEKLTTSAKNNNDLFAEKSMLQKKIMELDDAVEKFKMENTKTKADKEGLNEELSTLKKEYNSIYVENKHLNEQINTLNLDLENKMKDYNAALEEKNKLSEDILNLSSEYDLIITDKNALQSKLEDLENEFKIGKGKLDNLLSINKQLSVDISSLNKVINELNVEKKELQLKIDVLENTSNTNTVEETSILKKKVENVEKELEVNKKNYTKLLNQLTNEITSLKHNLEELEKERKAQQIIIEDLNTNNEIKESKYLAATESNNKLLDELNLLKLEKNYMITEKENLLEKLKSLEEEVVNNKNEISSQLKMRDGLYGELAVLKQEVSSITNRENDLLRERDKLHEEHENDQVNLESVNQEKNKLSGELGSIKKEFLETVFSLNQTKEQLQSQQETSNKLNNQLQDLSESYTNKCNDIQHQQQETAQLRTDLENITKQFNEINTSLSLMTNERDELLSNFIVNLNTVKVIREIQIELFSSVRKLKKEIMFELNDIKFKISKDLMFQVSSVLKTHEDHDRQVYELQCKSKEENDSYNSKIKSLQAQIINADKASNNCLLQDQSELQHQEVAHSNNSIGKECDVNMSDLSSDILSYKHRCNQLELSLNNALLIMKSIHNFVKEKSKYDSSVLTEENIVLETLRDDHIAAIKSFLDEHKTRDSNTKHSITRVNSDTEYNINDLMHESNGQPIFYLGNDEKLATANYLNKQLAIKSEEVIEKEIVEKINSSNICGENIKPSLEIQQLKQEIKLKEEIIKKLQFAVENFELEKEVFPPSITQGYSKETASILNINSDIEQGDSATVVQAGYRNGTHTNSDEQIVLLQQQNKMLNDKLETMKKTYETNIGHLTNEYEDKLKDMEDDIKMDEVQKSDKEKKFILNEMKEQIENLQHDLDQRGDAFEKLYEEHQQTLKSNDDQVRQLRMNYEKEMREQDKKWRSCLDRKLAEEELRHKEEMKILSSEWAAQRKELEMASKLAVSVVESGSSSSDLLRRQIQSLTLQITQLQNERCNCKQRRKSPTPLRIQDCTEMEYLRNILYDYMMGKEPVVLAKVLCALMKFNENQTNSIVNKEEQRLTLLGQLGIL